MKRSHCHLLQKVIGTAEWEQAEQGSWPSYPHRPAIAPQTLLIPSELCWAWRWKNGFRSFLQTANVPWETFQAIWVRETLTVLRSLFVYIYTHTHPENPRSYKGPEQFLELFFSYHIASENSRLPVCADWKHSLHTHSACTLSHCSLQVL